MKPSSDDTVRIAIATLPWTPLSTGRAWFELGEALLYRRGVGEALQAFEAAQAAGFDFHAVASRIWLCAMLLGRLDLAWEVSDQVLVRRRIDGLSCHDQPLHRQWLWDGRPPAGRDVLVRCHHGLGDIIQMARLLVPLRRLASRLRVQAPAAILPLLSRMEAIDELGDLAAAPPPHDMAMELMELPHALRLSWAGLPPASVFGVRHRPRRLGWEPMRVGIAWAAGGWRPERSLPLDILEPLATLPDLHLVCLQRGPALLELVGSGFPFAGHNRTDEVLATVAVMRHLDLVISVDTMVAHLAGSIGCPVWLLLDAAADWRWQIGRSDSPWYPSMRLFRQTTAGAWASVVETVRCELLAKLAAARHSAPAFP